MSAIDWKEYLTTVVTTFRRHYVGLTEDQKARAQLNMTLNEPCQIEFFSFENDGQLMLVTFMPEYPDEIAIHEHLRENFDFHSIYQKRLPRKEGDNIERVLKHYVKKGKVESGITWSSIGNNASLYIFAEDLQKTYPDPEKFSKMVLDGVRQNAELDAMSFKRSNEFARIRDLVVKINEDVNRIKEANIKEEVLRNTRLIDTSLSTVKELEEHEKRLRNVEQDIGGVRKMIGTTKEYQDFRVLATDVDDLKKSHIHKDVFESEIKRIDQRIDSLREIRFWSKRTIIDIVLAVVATASTTIATLLAAHII